MLYFISFHGCDMVVGAMVIPWLFHGFDMVMRSGPSCNLPNIKLLTVSIYLMNFVYR